MQYLGGDHNLVVAAFTRWSALLWWCFANVKAVSTLPRLRRQLLMLIRQMSQLQIEGISMAYGSF